MWRKRELWGVWHSALLKKRQPQTRPAHLQTHTRRAF